MQGTKEWTANIYPCNPAKCGNRVNRTVRLVQIDIAIKDKRSPVTGWVFGTFIYDASAPRATVWDRMVPVGLSWGDDSGISSMINTSGSFVNPALKETFLNPALVKTAANDGNKAFMNHFGLGGRLNGPVDNPISSCISCHGRAANLPNGMAASIGDFGTTTAKYPLTSFQNYFTTVPAGTGQLIQDGRSFTQSDYSLQLATGIRNYYQHQVAAANSNINGSNLSGGAKKKKPGASLPLVTRGGN